MADTAVSSARCAFQFSPEWFKQICASSGTSSSIKEIPRDFCFNSIREFLIESRNKTFDQDSVRAFKSLKAYKYFQEGYVQRIQTVTTKDDSVSAESIFVAKSEVMASMVRKVYSVFVCISKDGLVLGGSCDCVAGRGEACSHVAALLFALDDFVSRGLNEVPEDVSSTDKLRQWNVPARRTVEYCTIDKTHIYRPEFGRDKTPAKKIKRDPRHSDDKSINTSDLNLLHQQVSSILPNCGFAKYALKTCDSIDPSPDEERLLLKTLPPSMQDNIRLACEIFMDNLKSDSSKIVEIEETTRGQSQSDRWFKERHCRLTASNFHNVVNRRASTDPTPLLKKLLGYTSISTRAMRFGLEQEHSAAEKYVCYMKKEGYGDIEVKKEVGFVVSEDHPFLGASCDAIAFDGKRGKVVVEFKNPVSTWELSIGEAVNKLPCLRLDENCHPVLNRQHAYYSQIQGQMGVLKMQKCDFVLCTETDIFVETILFDELLWLKMIEKLETFYKIYMLPELVYPTLKYGYPLLAIQ